MIAALESLRDRADLTDSALVIIPEEGSMKINLSNLHPVWQCITFIAFTVVASAAIGFGVSGILVVLESLPGRLALFVGLFFTTMGLIVGIMGTWRTLLRCFRDGLKGKPGISGARLNDDGPSK